MRLQVGNVYTRVEADPEEESWLDDLLSFADDRAHWSGYGDGKRHMYSRITHAFPTGYVPQVRAACAARGFPFEREDRRVRPCEPDWSVDLGWLRDYQLEAVKRAVECGRGILHHPTGSGKSEVMIGLVQLLPCRWLLVAHRAGLTVQVAERYALRTGQAAQMVGDGQPIPDEVRERLVCATFQTIAAAMRRPADLDRVKWFLRQFEGILVDESHTLPSATYWRASMACKEAYYRIGVSGTPLARGDRRSTLAVASLGPVIHRILPEQLIKAGVLTRPSIRMIAVQHRTDRPTWQGVYGEEVVRSVARNALVAREAARAPRPCLVFVGQIRHGELLLARLLKEGVRAEFVWGEDDTDARRDALRRLEAGELDVLVTSVIMQEGVDVPGLRAVIVATGGKSIIAALQRIGRGMRVAPGKDSFQVVDFDDRGHRWLEKHSKARRRAYEREGYHVTVEEVQACLTSTTS